jgi:hypothetical protein
MSKPILPIYTPSEEAAMVVRGKFCLEDSVTKKLWVVSIVDGKLSLEPFEKAERREYRIDQILGDGEMD